MPFDEGSGRWLGAEEWTGWLSRRSPDLSSAAILRSDCEDVGRVVCETEGAFDVHLLTGDDSLAAPKVLGVGIGALVNGDGVVDGTRLKSGHKAGCYWHVGELRAEPMGLPSSVEELTARFEGRDGPTGDEVTRSSDGRELRTVAELEAFAAELRREGLLAT